MGKNKRNPFGLSQCEISEMKKKFREHHQLINVHFCSISQNLIRILHKACLLLGNRTVSAVATHFLILA